MNSYLSACAALLAASVAVSASAQGAVAEKPTAQRPPIPIDQRTPSSLIQYRNVFGDYRPSTDAVVPWREANDLVGRIGGWRVYAREAQRETPVPAEPQRANSSNAETKKP